MQIQLPNHIIDGSAKKRKLFTICGGVIQKVLDQYCSLVVPDELVSSIKQVKLVSALPCFFFLSFFFFCSAETCFDRHCLIDLDSSSWLNMPSRKWKP
jgi:hypothetical protein